MSNTWFVDLNNGSDSNNGTSFAQRVKTLSKAASLASAGDTVRVMGNASTNSGTATWTNGSSLVTLSASLTQLLYADGAWTAGTHVTCSAVTSSPSPKQGTNCAKMACASTFTTGKVAYHATGTLNLSGYQQVSFWIQSSVALAAGALEIELCSDTAGATAVNTLTLNQALNANQWTNVTLNNGSALSSSIKSINITAVLSLASTNIYIDDVVACNAPSAAGCLTIGTLISPDNQTWYPIQSIDGTSVYLDGPPNVYAATAAPGWQGSTGTTTFYMLQPTQVTIGSSSSSYAQTFSLSGNSGSPVTISGGWDSTSMTTQSGWTTIDMMDSTASSVALTGSAGYVTVDHVNFTRAYYGLGVASSAQGYVLSNSTGSALQQPLYGGVVATLSNCNLINCSGGISVFGTSAVNCNIYGAAASEAMYCGGAGTIVSGCNCSGNPSGLGFQVAGPCAAFLNNKASNNQGGQFQFNDSSLPMDCYSLTAYGTYPIFIGESTVRIYGLDTNTPGGSASPQISLQNGTAIAYNWMQYTGSSPAASLVYFESGEGAGYTDTSNSFSQQENGNAADNTVRSFYGTATTAGIIGENGSAPGWQLSPNAYAFQSSPLTIKVGTLACPANQTTQVTYWAKVESTSVNAQLRVAGGRYPGVGAPGADIKTAVTSTSWAQYTVSFTPTENCVVDVFFDAWGSSTQTATISGPMSIGQYTDYNNLSTYEAEPFITTPLVNTLSFGFVYQAQPFVVANPPLITYSTDSLGRLAQVTLGNGTTVAYSPSTSPYDKMGNRTEVVTTAGPIGL